VLDIGNYSHGLVGAFPASGSDSGTRYAFDLTGSDTEAEPIRPDPHALVPDLRLTTN
jgi:hypothetical protein